MIFQTHYMLKYKFIILIVLPIILFLAQNTNAQKLQLGNQQGDVVTILPLNNYLQIKLSQLNVSECDAPGLFSKIFLNRAYCGIGYIEINYGWQKESLKFPLFSYIKNSKKKYQYTSLGVNRKNTYDITGRFTVPQDGQIDVKLIVKNWDKNLDGSMAQSIINIFGSMISGSSQAIEAGTTFIEMIKIMFPKTDTDDSLTIPICFDNIHKQYLPISLTDNNNKIDFIELFLNIKGSIFKTFYLDDNLKSAQIPEVDFWRKAISSAGSKLEQTGLYSFEKTLKLFAEHVRTLPLTAQDKALYLAGAIHTWSPETMRGFNYKNEPCRFYGSNFRSIQLSPKDMNFIRNTEWDIEEMDGRGCGFNDYACKNLDYFIRNSQNKEDRKLNGSQHINKLLYLKIDNSSPIKIDTNEYENNFTIISNALFHRKKPLHPIVYDFKNNELEIEFQNKFYYGKIIHMNRCSRDTDIHYIRKIEIESQSN